MNIFFVIDDQLVTPPLSETILGGITRDSLLRLAPSLGLAVAERSVAVDELITGIRSGRVQEAFGAGTAAVVAPVAALGYRDEMFTIGEGAVGKLTQKLYNALTDIQYGRSADQMGWLRKL